MEEDKAKDVYINGSDLLMDLGGGCIDHCSSHTTTFNTETKSRAVKPAREVESSQAIWTYKGVTGKSVSIKGDGLRADETENGFGKLLDAYNKGEALECKAFRRGEEKPYMTGMFIVTNLEEVAPAQDDATYSVTLENSGPVAITANNA